MTDPLPPSAALPLREGENTLPDSDGFNVPLTEGDERERHCRERRGSLKRLFVQSHPGRLLRNDFHRIETAAKASRPTVADCSRSFRRRFPRGRPGKAVAQTAHQTAQLLSE